jgi:prephenate dehydrogenase
MTTSNSFRRAAILGTGLIGGSFALALRKYAPEIRVAGWDRDDAARDALTRDAIQEAFSGDLAPAIAGADLVYIALPIGVTMDLLPEIVRLAAPAALITDACSTKQRICQRAAEVFAQSPQRVSFFLPGHPMAGKEVSGVANAAADLFQDAAYALIGDDSVRDEPRVQRFVRLLERIGARPLWLAAKQHDYAVALASQLPQLCAVALGSFLYDRLDENGLPVTLSGPGLRDSLRLAGSSYANWRDILLTNREFLSAVLDLFARHLDELREKLSSRELEADFDAANELYKLLRDLK